MQIAPVVLAYRLTNGMTTDFCVPSAWTASGLSSVAGVTSRSSASVPAIP
jgi:hypothetical protein